MLESPSLYIEAKMVRTELTSLQSTMASGKGLKSGEKATASCRQIVPKSPVWSPSCSREILATMPNFQVLQGILGQLGTKGLRLRAQESLCFQLSAAAVCTSLASKGKESLETLTRMLLTCNLGKFWRLCCRGLIPSGPIFK